MEAGPSTPVKITGLSGLPEAGSDFIVVKDEKEASEVSEERAYSSKNTQLLQAKRSRHRKLHSQQDAETREESSPPDPARRRSRISRSA